MTKQEIVSDVKKKLRFDIKGNDVRSEIQDELVKLNSDFLILELPTGFGKSLVLLKKIGKQKTLIVVSQLYHEQNWINEAGKWNVDLSNVTFVCYNSLEKHKDEHWDFIALDEGHRWSDMWTEKLTEFTFKKLMILSGTIPLDTKKKSYNIGKPKTVSISTEDAVNWNVLPEPEINVISLYLDNKNSYLKFEKGKNKQKETVECTFFEWTKKYKWMGAKRPNLLITCTEQEYYSLIDEELEWTKSQFFRTNNNIFSMRMKILGNQRKKFIAELKTRHVKRLMDRLKDNRLVVFANSIEQAEMFDTDAVHSKNKRGQEIIDEFNSFKRNLLVSVRQLNESLNLTEPEHGIIVQLNGSKKGQTKKVNVGSQQQVGRLIRAVAPKVYIFVYRNTQDEVYLNDFKSTLSHDWFKSYSF
jgi:superfamily II DNA or RNA helicase